jgi:Flp pilus assembly protein TadB
VSTDHAVTAALAMAWTTLVLAAAGLRTRPHHRLPPSHPTAVAAPPRPRAARRLRWVTRLGAAINDAAPGRAHAEAESRVRADRRTGWAALTCLALLAAAPALAPVPLAVAIALPTLAARTHRRRQTAALVDQLPDVVDLLALTTAVGLPVSAAVTAIADRPGGPLGGALARAAAHVRHGGSLADALTHITAVGPEVRPLADALTHYDRYGGHLLPALSRVGIEARARRRRHAEEAARRLPVTLLFPLVLTTFPAFVALTVVPLLAGSLGSLSP